MPELPEVETLRRDLDKEVIGRRIKTVAVANGKRSVRRHKSAKRVPGPARGPDDQGRSAGLGKYLLIGLDDGDILVVHLGMSGQLLRVEEREGAQAQAHPRGHHLHPGRRAALRRPPDLRRDVRLDPARARRVASDAGRGDGVAAQVPELAHLGFDPLEDVMSWDRFAVSSWPTSTRRLKTLLMDQQFVAGIGNIYSDEILFAAGLRYDRRSDSLSATEIRRLYRAMVETLAEAIKHRGSSLADEQYRDLFGEIGDYQGQHQVYDREGQACRRAATRSSGCKVNGRSTFLCEHCQI